MSAHALDLNRVSPGAPVLPPTRTLQEYSELRVGQVWRREDHEHLLKRLCEIDELCIAVWQRISAAQSQQK